jgi:hypothetical protein
MNKKLVLMLGVLLLAGASTAALAGGPNYTFDYANRVPYAWVPAHWPGGAVPVFTDLGNLKNASPLVTNQRADELVAAAWAQWNAVPTSTFRAQVSGDFESIGLPEINRTNAGLVIGKDNGGGIHVIYDHDGGIMADFFGASGILGIATFEFVITDSPEIYEGWAVINGTFVRTADTNQASFAGVFTHEFGHDVNLGHSQANGATVRHLDPAQPRGCAAPWTGTPGLLQMETMYPFIGINNPNDTGAGMATVDRIDDKAAISDLYPAPGWPESHGIIRGTVSSLLNINGSGNGDMVQTTAVNVVARNVADPFNDFSSYISGQVSKGQVGEDGSFEFHGLTPGAQYVIYLDNLMSGAYNVPRLLTLPGPEEYYNGAGESGDGRNDDRCAWTTITAAPGSPVTADIVSNRVKGAPSMTWLPAGHIGSRMTPDGSKIVGTVGEQYFVMDTTTGTIENIGGYAPTGGSPSISDDGTRVSGNYRDLALNEVGWGIYENGAWTKLPLRADAVTPCLFGTIKNWGSSFGMSGDGQTVVGGSYANGCSNAGFRATKWTPTGGTVTLPKSPDSPTRANRANRANYDGSVIAGWDDHSFGYRRGVYWVNGAEHFFGSLGESNFFGEGLNLTRDGSQIVGIQAGLDGIPGAKKAAWRFHVPTGEMELLSNNSADRNGAAYTIDDAGSVISGWNTLSNNARQATIWTEDLGWVPFGTFLNAQGTWYEGTEIGNGVDSSADGKRLLVYSATTGGNRGWILDIPKAVVCHRPPGYTGETHTIDVTFPGGLGNHLAHGDTVGICQHGGE